MSLILGNTAEPSPLQSLGYQLKMRPSIPLVADTEPAIKEPVLGLEKSVIHRCLPSSDTMASVLDK